MATYTNLMLFMFVFINQSSGRVITSNSAPRCMIRGGREFMVAFQRPSSLQSQQMGDDLYLEWSIGSVTRRGTESCWVSSDDSNLITCPTTWSLYNVIMKSWVKVQVVNAKNQQIIWKHATSFVPIKHLFDCFTNINVHTLKLFESRKTNKWNLSWRLNSIFRSLYKPRYEVSIQNKSFKNITSQQCSHKKVCVIDLPDTVRGTLATICVKSIFELNAKTNYYTTTTKSSIFCTATSFNSHYRLKVINVKTGQEVIDYGLWHHIQGQEKLTKETFLSIKNTKKKFQDDWKRLKTSKREPNISDESK